MPLVASIVGFGAVSPHARRALAWLICVVVFHLCAPMPLMAQTTIVSSGANWRYLADGSNQGTNWRGVAFDDLAWPTGPAPLGFGEGDLATITASGVGPITTYFRHVFTVADRLTFTTLTLRVRRDDGVMIYFNDRHIVQNNIPTGPVNHLTLAASSVGGGSESRWIQYGISPAYLLNGSNVLAVELHQASDGENDARFDLELIGNLPPSPPTVSINPPEDMEVLNPGPLTVRVQATDLDGHISRVTIYTNSVRAFTGFEEPYEFTFMAVPGRYLLMAEAVDNLGWMTDSESVRIQVGTVGVDRVLRGPYLQSVSSTSAIVCWRTDWFTSSRVLYGTDPESLNFASQGASLDTEHAVALSGLQPYTRYYYAIGTTNQVLADGSDYFFKTAPTNSQPTRIWAIGDAGTAGVYQRKVRDAFEDFAEPGLADVWLMLGDNAYECGSDNEYQAAVFDVYPRILRRVGLWPAIGNHDAGCYSDSSKFPYLDIFHLPTQGEAGGVASGTEKYYSFDHGNIHFVCLDSQTSVRQSGGPMLTWLEQDLAATEKDWIITYWHHPPYSFGTHNSDTEVELIEMRQQVAPILESYGVDLVLSGHSHVYERSYLLNGHYGMSGTFDPAYILDVGFGREDEDRAYQKPAGGIGANQGTVYVVCGCSGEGGYSTVNIHPAMRRSLGGRGSMVLDIDGLRLDAKFLTETGSIADYFSIQKGMPPVNVRPALSLKRADNRASISWPTSLRPFRLEASERMESEGSWHVVPKTPVQVGRQQAVTIDLVRSNEVFRLKAEP